MRAIWNDRVIADSEDTIIVEGNHYFPADSVNSENLRESDTSTRCVWKGTASYYDVVVDDEVNADAAWTYTEPLRAAEGIRGRIAFWKGVQVVE
jgi:uncharacterized protein (DUF427 family)